eukprot:SAG31_NODE_8743_length_1395_cov_8.237617_3_plen_89_part_00
MLQVGPFDRPLNGGTDQDGQDVEKGGDAYSLFKWNKDTGECFLEASRGGCTANGDKLLRSDSYDLYEMKNDMQCYVSQKKSTVPNVCG